MFLRRLQLRIVLYALVAALSGGCTAREPEDRFEVVETTIGELQEAVRTGRISCREVVQSYLDRIESYDESSGLNAITEVNPDALEKAEAIDGKLAREEPLGSLFCAPILVKDNFDTADLPTTAGSIALRGHFPPDDAFMVRRIREADGIILAKTNMAEWAFSPRQTESSSYGSTANAYALDRVPAGSSGGTASGVAANFGVAGLGTDTGNSIRGPSSHLALVGLRSTIGLTSRDGVVPLSLDFDIAGPMTRTVEDAARIFNVIAGYDPADPYTALGRGRREDDYTRFLDENGLQGSRIGVLRTLVDTEDADPEVISLFEKALQDLRSAGATIVDPVEIENFAFFRQSNYYCPRFRYDLYNYLSNLEDPPFLDAATLRESGQYSRSFEPEMEYYCAAPLETPPETWDTSCLPYPGNPIRKAFLEATVTAMDQATVDVLIYPTWTNPPAHLENPREEYKGDNSQLVAPATGMPALTVPMGYSYGIFPAGLQILGRPYAEGSLFRIAYAYEQRTTHRRSPGSFPPLR